MLPWTVDGRVNITDKIVFREGYSAIFLTDAYLHYLRWLVTGFPMQHPGSDPKSGHVGYVVDKVALGQVFSEYLDFPCQFLFHRILSIH
jgi:hypothetical protein